MGSRSVRQNLVELKQLAGLSLPFGPDEKLYGFYENAVGKVDDILLFTDQGMYWLNSGNWIRLRYSDIRSTEWPKEEKMDAKELSLNTRSGQLQIPILGGTEHTRDLFSFMRFFDRVIEDLEN